MTAPLAKLSFAPAAVDIETRRDGSMILRSPQRLGPYPRSVGAMLLHWAETTPDAVVLAERSGPGWRTLTFRETAAAARSIGQAALDRRLSSERPIVIVSDNGIDHALLALGAMHVGVPVCPVSPAYSLMSRDHAKLNYIMDLIRPGLVYAADGQRFETALAAVDLGGAELVVSSNPASATATHFGTLTAATPTAAVDDAFADVGPDTVAKILFTSGSTDLPKGVINTQRMMCANQQAIAQLWPFLSEKPPVIVDWLPWNHTFGANHNFNMMLRHGGTLYIDDGKPAPGLIERTVAQSARDRADDLFQRPARLRHAAAVS